MFDPRRFSMPHNSSKTGMLSMRRYEVSELNNNMLRLLETDHIKAITILH